MSLKRNPADAVQQWPVDRLQAFPRNSRTHSPAQVSQIAASIREFGFAVPVLAQADGTIIAGHARVLAARQLGLESVPVMVAAGWSDAQVRAYVIADNKLALNSAWDEELLAVELDELRDLKFDMSLMGFEARELNDLIGTPNTGVDPDEVPLVPVVPVSRAGDLWLLGAHRILCGDSTKPADVVRLMGGAKAELFWTDPPYNVDYVGKTADALKLDGDAQATAVFVAMLVDAFKSADAVMLPGAGYYVAHPDIFAYEFVGAVRSVGWWQARPPVVLWVKDSMVMGRGDYHARSEPVLYGWKPGAAHHAVVDRAQDNVWEIPRPKASAEHPTMKPVELVARALRNSTDHGDAVLDLFAGSGTTAIAAEQTGRAAFLMELRLDYTDVSVLRWQAYTGLSAILDGTDKTFEDVKRERPQAKADAVAPDRGHEPTA